MVWKAGWTGRITAFTLERQVLVGYDLHLPVDLSYECMSMIALESEVAFEVLASLYR